MKPKVYLAGKITNNFWREKLGANSRCINSREEYFNSELECEDFIWTGPYAIGCDHKCYHSTPHAAVASHTDCMGLELTKSDVTYNCLNQIAKSDFVFAYIDSLDAYGTFAEIGFARALDIPIFIYFENEELKDTLWFMSEMAVSAWFHGGLISKFKDFIDVANYLVNRGARQTKFEYDETPVPEKSIFDIY